MKNSNKTECCKKCDNPSLSYKIICADCPCHSPAEVSKKVSKCCGVNGVVSNKQVIGEKIKIDCSKCKKPFEPAELNLASQDWEERFLMATIYQEDSGFQKFGEGEPTKWKTDWDKVKQFIEKEISLARTEAVAEYKAELVEKIHKMENPYNSVLWTTLMETRFENWRKDLLSLISPNKE